MQKQRLYPWHSWASARQTQESLPWQHWFKPDQGRVAQTWTTLTALSQPGEGRHTCTGAALHSRDLGQQSFHRCGLLALGLFPAFFPRAETLSSFQSQLTSHFLGDFRPDSPPNGIMPPCSFFLNIPGYFLSFGYHGFSV